MKTILVADDNADGREMLRDFLEAWGYAVVEASDGEEALANIRQRVPDLVLLDLQMPRIDGYAVIRAIKTNPGLAQLPAIAITAFAMQGDRKKATAAGFDAYMAKPVDFRQLRAVVEELLAKANGKRLAGMSTK